MFVNVKVNAWLELIDGTGVWMTWGKSETESCEPNKNTWVEVEYGLLVVNDQLLKVNDTFLG
jgi:hypothetical protein